jgi:glycosyltransferase involved in cell wall biosynthesis
MGASEIQLTVVTRNRAGVLATHALPGLQQVAEEGGDVLVVDQSSDDSTADLLAGTEVRYLRTATRGLAAGRNVALRTARAPWIAFTDDDVRPTPAWLSAISAAIAAEPQVSAVLGRGIHPDGELMAGGPPGQHRWPTDIFTLGSGYSLAVAGRHALRVGGFHPRFGTGAWFGAAEDTLMLYRLLRDGHSVLCADEVQIVHPEWRSGPAQAWRQFRYGRGTAALALVSLAAGDQVTIGRAGARMVRQGRRVIDLALVRRWRDAAIQACYLAGAASALDAPVVLSRDGARSPASPAEDDRIPSHRRR